MKKKDHISSMQAFAAQRDPQGAAEYIASLPYGSSAQGAAMKAAEAAGFIPEYYADSIRVRLAS